MKLSGLIQNIYQQIFIGIVIQHSSMKVCVQLRKGKKLEKEISRHFEIAHATPSAEANEFIRSFMDESPFSYVAVLNDTLNQGAIPTCSMHQAENFNDLGSCVTICSENRWMVYAEKSELNALQKRFLINGLDFIFSPFFIMSQFFGDKIQGKTSLLVLIQDDYLSLCIFNDGDLLFAKHYATKDAVEDESMSADIEETASDSLGFNLDDEDNLSINLDDIDALDELDALDDLDNLQDLDDLDDLDEIEDFEESLNEAVEESEVALEEAKSKYDGKIDNFSDDYKRFQLIQASLQQFYNDDKYNNQFVEETYIADACESGPDLIKFLEEELFVSAYKRSIDLEKELVKMAIQEVKYAI
ncbi:MAG: hypothetical protein COA44_08250 [Arcobacter sp.]|nr:MAG: hypothetical protein COA44_08250 [Arcobacter sp.]